MSIAFAHLSLHGYADEVLPLGAGVAQPGRRDSHAGEDGAREIGAPMSARDVEAPHQQACRTLGMADSPFVPSRAYGA